LREKESAAPAIIEAQGLVKSFAGAAVVDGLSFCVPSGRIFGILGPNGAGKTTTIRMVYGFSPKSQGLLRVFGLDIDTRWREIRSRIGVCQQDNTLDPDLTVEKNLLVFASYFSMPRAEAKVRTEELLDFFALKERKDSDVRELSGGLARRLMLARALINQPELLILDEPTSGLDPQSRNQVWDRLLTLRAQGITILLTTHYMDEAATLCDDILIMDHGRELVRGTPAELIARHVGQVVLELVEPDQQARDLVTASSLTYDDLGRRLLVYASSFEDLELLGERLGNRRRVARPSTLEDVFLRLTGRELR
jgi:lipooligosaccharide transport system ATP-binding protein